MRKTAIIFALLLAACRQEPDASANLEGDTNVEMSANGDVPIPGGENQMPPALGSNEQAPAPPTQNDANPAPEPSGQVTLTAAPVRTGAGSTMTLTLTNGSRQTVGYNLCTSSLQTAAGTEVRTDRVCTLELRTLEPSKSANYRYQLPDSLPDGRYRFSTRLDRMPDGSANSVTSNSFEVR